MEKQRRVVTVFATAFVIGASAPALIGKDLALGYEWTRGERSTHRATGDSQVPMNGGLGWAAVFPPFLGRMIEERIQESGAATHVRTLSGKYALSARQGLEVGLEVGFLTIEAGGTGQVEALIRAECDASDPQCQDLLSQVKIESKRDESFQSLQLNVLDPSREQGHQLVIRATLIIPDSVSLRVNSRIGQVRIRGLEEDMNVDVGIGSVEIDVPQSKVSRVELNADVGGTRLLGQGNEGKLRKRTRGLSGSDLKWTNGSGDAGVVVRVGIGSISVRLQPY